VKTLKVFVVQREWERTPPGLPSTFLDLDTIRYSREEALERAALLDRPGSLIKTGRVIECQLIVPK
jgi:hypothetical protein